MDAMSTLTETGLQDGRRAEITILRPKSSDLREIKCHTMPSKVRANSLKTNDGGPDEVSHFFGGLLNEVRREENSASRAFPA